MSLNISTPLPPPSNLKRTWQGATGDQTFILIKLNLVRSGGLVNAPRAKQKSKLTLFVYCPTNALPFTASGAGLATTPSKAPLRPVQVRSETPPSKSSYCTWALTRVNVERKTKNSNAFFISDVINCLYK